MEALLAFVSQPITQLGAVIAVGAALQRWGFDIKGALRGALGMTATPVTQGSIDFDNRTALQELLNSMQVLTGHFNHETTDLLTEIRDELKEIKAGVSKTNTTLEVFDRAGLPCRK